MLHALPLLLAVTLECKDGEGEGGLEEEGQGTMEREVGK